MDSTTQGRSPLRRRVLAGVFAALALLFVVFTPFVALVTGYNGLTAQTEMLVDDAIASNTATFLAVSAIKAGLAVVEGSAVGVGFELEVGDLVQPVYDYVDFIWKALLYALMVLGLYKLLLEAGLLGAGLKLIGVGFALWAAGLLARRQRRLLVRWGRAAVVLGLLLAYVVPAALWATHFLSRHYTDPLKARYDAQIISIKAELGETADELMTLRERVSVLRPGESLEEVKAAMLVAMHRSANLVWGGATAFVSLVVILFFEQFVFPLLSAYVLYRFVQYAVDRLLQQSPVMPPARGAGEAAG
jgi:hypothetical protein